MTTSTSNRQVKSIHAVSHTHTHTHTHPARQGIEPRGHLTCEIHLFSVTGLQWKNEYITLGTDPEVWVRFPALPDFPRSSGSGTASTQPREYN
jgi:hypothetical protein